MRTDKELLEILLKALKSAKRLTGLCAVINFDLHVQGYISAQEWDRLHVIIEENKPKDIFRTYWWPSGHRTPRIEFLNNLILKYDGNIRKV